MERLRDRDAVGVFACLDCEGEVALASTTLPTLRRSNPRRRLEDHLERVLEQGEAIDTLQDSNLFRRRSKPCSSTTRSAPSSWCAKRCGWGCATKLVEHVQAGGHIEDIRHDRDQGEERRRAAEGLWCARSRTVCSLDVCVGVHRGADALDLRLRRSVPANGGRQSRRKSV